METTLLTTAAMILLSISAMQFAIAGVMSSRARRGRRLVFNRNLRHLRQAAEIARLSSQLQANSKQKPTMDWRVMEVAEIVQESEDCRSFYLTDPYGQPLPEFKPGQHLMVRPAMAGAYQTTRCYSLSSAPNSNYWRITVKREIPATSHKPRQSNGGLSDWLHRTIHSGDCLLIGGPNGQFYLDEQLATRPLVLMAAGVGITPMASMMRWSLEHSPDRPMALHFQARDLRHWPLGETLHAWKEDYPDCEVHSYLTRESTESLSEARRRLPGQFHAGRVSADDVLKVRHAEESDYFMCGPDEWMQSLRRQLEDAGIKPERVHWESFGSAGSQPAAVSGPVSNSLPVRFQHSQVDAQWSDAEQTLWELARESQVEIPSGCLSGVCGCCRVKLLEGEVEYDRQISIELADDECLTCVSRPKTPLLIDA